MKGHVLIAAVAALILILVCPLMAVAEGGFAVGPPSVDVAVSAEGGGTACVYITSEFDGEVVIGTQEMPFRVEPETIQVSSTDEYREIELTLYRDEAVEGIVDDGSYPGKLTFVKYLDSGNVGMGVRMDATVTYSGHEEADQEEKDEETGGAWTDFFRDHYIEIILGILVIVALIVGIGIGSRRRHHAAQ